MQTINFFENIAKNTHHTLVNERFLTQQVESIASLFTNEVLMADNMAVIQEA